LDLRYQRRRLALISGHRPFFKAPTMIPLNNLRTAVLFMAKVVLAALA
jgi:hypothetical protein